MTINSAGSTLGSMVPDHAKSNLKLLFLSLTIIDLHHLYNKNSVPQTNCAVQETAKSFIRKDDINAVFSCLLK